MFLDEQDIYNFTNFLKFGYYDLPFGYGLYNRTGEVGLVDVRNS